MAGGNQWLCVWEESAQAGTHNVCTLLSWCRSSRHDGLLCNRSRGFGVLPAACHPPKPKQPHLLQLAVAGDQQEVELQVSPQRAPTIVAAADRRDHWCRPAAGCAAACGAGGRPRKSGARAVAAAAAACCSGQADPDALCMVFPARPAKFVQPPPTSRQQRAGCTRRPPSRRLCCCCYCCLAGCRLAERCPSPSSQRPPCAAAAVALPRLLPGLTPGQAALLARQAPPGALLQQRVGQGDHACNAGGGRAARWGYQSMS